jgi:ABC-type phosphate transport system permease subunit
MAHPSPEAPRRVESNPLADVIFHNVTRFAALLVFSLLAAILVSLVISSWPSINISKPTI